MGNSDYAMHYTKKCAVHAIRYILFAVQLISSGTQSRTPTPSVLHVMCECVEESNPYHTTSPFTSYHIISYTPPTAYNISHYVAPTNTHMPHMFQHNAHVTPIRPHYIPSTALHTITPTPHIHVPTHSCIMPLWSYYSHVFIHIRIHIRMIHLN